MGSAGFATVCLVKDYNDGQEVIGINSMSDFDSHTLTATTIILAIGISVLAGIFVSYISGLVLWLTPAQKLGAFIIGFALMCTLAITEIYHPTSQWKDMAMVRSLPLLVSVIYFLPTIAAISVECEIYRSVFLVNLFFGWTVIGWIAAMLMAFRPQERDIHSDLSYRLTPFGVVPRKAIAANDSRTIASRRLYVPVLRREL
jgi:hypothetical protein